MPFLEKSLGTNSKFRERCGSFEHPFSIAGRAGKADGFVQKRPNFHQNQIRESDACGGENLEVLYIMNLVSLVAFENFE